MLTSVLCNINHLKTFLQLSLVACSPDHLYNRSGYQVSAPRNFSWSPNDIFQTNRNGNVLPWIIYRSLSFTISFHLIFFQESTLHLAFLCKIVNGRIATLCGKVISAVIFASRGPDPSSLSQQDCFIQI